ncbi:MAG: PGF-pre-PGF domain-containing protein [Methanoregula sp.]|nr:PGF-pre-PGF domain-containing protein [Methanoregula sp.]
MKRDHLAVCLIITLFVLIPAAQALPLYLAITQPSANETNFAEMRDFYVYGVFTTSPLGTPGDVKIELFPTSSCTGWSGTVTCTGTPLRQLQSHVDPVTGTTPQSCLNLSFVNGITVKGGYVPDIVENPDGSNFTDPNNKVVVTDRYYAGLVLGGVTKTYNTTYKDSSGHTLTDLTAGDYTILVTGLSGTLNGQVIAKNITFGITNTALGTNRPPDNKNARINYAIQHNLRTYFDSFPGYFSDGGSNWSNFVSRAYPNNGIEVVNDLSGTILDTVAVANNTMFMYNINAASTTYSVELAPILRYKLQDSENTTFLYYSNGETFLTYIDTTGTSQNVASTIKQFTGTNRLALTRVEIRSPPPSSYENLYDPNDTAQKTEYTDLSGGVTLTQGQEFIVFGVVKPIASTVATTSYPYWYSIDNRTSNITYTITNSSGGTVLTATHDVNLSRYYTPGSTTRYNSLFEFGSEFTTLTTPGTYQVSLTGKDNLGNIVPGTTASFSVTVNSPPASPGSDGGSSSGAIQAAYGKATAAQSRVTFAFAPPTPGNTVSVQSVILYPSKNIGESELVVQPVTPGPASQISDREVAGYQSIDLNWVSPESSVDHADIMFTINNAWLTEHMLTPDAVVMLRYHDNRWQELPTRLDHSEGNLNYYIATTPGFSYFAIASRANTTGNNPNAAVIVGNISPSVTTVPVPAKPLLTEASIIPPTATTPVPVTVPLPNAGFPVITIVIAVGVIILIVVAILLIRRWWIRRQNPSLFRKYD